MRILALNAGSSSVKLRVVSGAATVEAAHDLGAPDGSLEDSLRAFTAGVGPLDATAHRVVHGGARFLAPVVVGGAVRRDLEAVSELAPLHNPPALAGLDALARLLPGVPAVACFDTAFHATLPAEAVAYALPQEWAQRWGIRRFGFHGLSCAWALRRAGEMIGVPADRLRLVVCHLGSGASVTAVVGGRSVDTTMGFTPVEGLVMSTRSGDVDPGALAWMLERGMDKGEMSAGLEHRAGLLGLSGGRTGDMRELLAARSAGDAAARLAVDVYLHRLRAKVAAMAAAAEGVDVLVFTGGVGEHSPVVRGECCAGLGWLGVDLDPDANAAAGPEDLEISRPGAAVRTLVVHAREELQMALECRAALGGG